MSRRRTVAGRILAAYALVLVAFSVTLTWSAYAQRRAAQQALLLRTGYMPLLLSLSTALETQNLVSAQLNHITDARNPEDARRWIETQRRLRPVAFVGVRSAIDRGLVRGRDTRAQQLGNDILVEVVAVESFLGSDGTRLAALFGALERGNELAAAEERERLIEHEIEGARRLRELSRRVERAMDDLSTEAASREHRAVELLVLLGAISLAVGVGTALYVRRARPLQSPPRDEIGELAGTFESMVEAIGRARGELVAAERMAAVGRMAAHVTHEIRNPISALGLNGELLEEELMPLDGADEARVLLRAMRSEIDRLAALSEHYLSLARRPTRQLEEGDVGDLVGSLLTFVRPELERARVQSRLDVAPGLPEVRLDEAQLRQALLNLIRNAREAMPSGGQLALSAHPVDGGVELCVDDTGEGIPDSLRASLFDPFFTTKKQGTGLGLAVTREIVDAHGGRIACEARPGGGTRFRLWLPEAAAGGDDGAGAAAQA